MKKDLMFYNISFSLLLGIFVIYFLSFIGFLFHISINLLYPYIGILTVLISIFFFSKKENLNIKETIYSYIFLIIPIFIFYFLSITIIDTTYDGREYHQASTILLKQGYNPVYDTAQDFFNKLYNIKHTVPIWVENYPKCFEIIAANIFLFTEKIESGKIVNSLSSIILFFYSYYIIKRYYNNKFNIFFAFLFVINPISIFQVMTFYSDVFIYNMFIIALIRIIDIIKTQTLKPYLIFFISIILLTNIKYGGLVYSIFLLLLLFILLIKQKISLKHFKTVFIISFILIILSGINPYFTNIARGMNPIYPLAGKDKIDIISKNLPINFGNKSILYKFFMSTFSKSENPYKLKKYEVFANLKIPFSIDENEIKYLDIDTRIGGFGVWWSGILILSLIGIFKLKNKKNLILLLFLFFTVITCPQNWWARYIPQFYALPVFISLFLLQEKSLQNKILSASLYTTILINSCLSLYSITVERYIYFNDHFYDYIVMDKLNQEDFLISYLQHVKEDDRFIIRESSNDN